MLELYLGKQFHLGTVGAGSSGPRRVAADKMEFSRHRPEGSESKYEFCAYKLIHENTAGAGPRLSVADVPERYISEGTRGLSRSEAQGQMRPGASSVAKRRCCPRKIQK